MPKKPTAQPVAQTGTIVIDGVLNDAIAEWKKIKHWLKTAEPREMELRKLLIEKLFSTVKEGTNRNTGPGIEAKLVQPVKREIDLEKLPGVMEQFPENSPLRVLGNLVRVEQVIVFSKDAYNALSPAERKIFDQALTISEQSPQLEITIREEAVPDVVSPAPVEALAPDVLAKATREASKKKANKPAPKKPGKPVKPAPKKPVHKKKK